MRSIERSHRRFVTFAAGALLLGAPLVSSAPAEAAPLDKNGCAKLAQDMQNLKALDVDKLMENGPAWAVNHLSSADLGLVRQYIDLDEQMKFRCAAPGSLVHLKHLEDEDDETGAKPADDASGGKAQHDKSEASASKPAEAKPAKARPKPKPPEQASSAAR
jgi:hypothetical protein